MKIFICCLLIVMAVWSYVSINKVAVLEEPVNKFISDPSGKPTVTPISFPV